MARELDTNLGDRMSEHEALMWNIEKDPWLNPSGGSIILLDQQMDMERFRRTLRAGVARTPRLYQRAVPGFGRLSTPAWVPDSEFDIDAHIREMVLPAPGGERQLLDLAARLYAEPLDRTRPLWRFVVITGLADGGSAIWAMMHHSVSDGIGQLRMAEVYQQLTRDEPGPDDVDLEAVIRQASAATQAKESGGDVATGVLSTVRDSTGHVFRRQLGIGRRLAGEVIMWPADPTRITATIETVVDTARGAAAQLAPRPDRNESTSPLWVERSRHRHLGWVRLELADLKAAGAVLGGTVNDVFMTGLAEAAHRYHAARGSDIDTVRSSFVVSTRRDDTVGGNAFTPVPIVLPAGPMSIPERFTAISAALESAKEESQRTGGMTSLSGVANLLPVSVVTRAARSAARNIDFATSNLRGAPFEVYCSGAKVLATVPVGPVAGTGANITAMSYDGMFDIGIFSDPAAITEPDAFRDDVEAAFLDLFDAAN